MASAVIDFQTTSPPGAAISLDHEVEVSGQVFRAHVNGTSREVGVAIAIELSPEDGYIIEEPVTGIFGVGGSVEAAFEDFATALVEYHRVLRGEERISARLAEHLSYLDGILGN